jgi:transcriptional regulator with XRE-family HTH domain
MISDTVLENRLKFLLERNVLSQKDLSEKVKMPQSLISLYCNGKKIPSKKTMIKISSVLNCSPKWLMNGEGSPEDEFNDYIFKRIIDNPVEISTKFTLSRGSKGSFEMNILIEKEEMETIFNSYLKIIQK